MQSTDDGSRQAGEERIRHGSSFGAAAGACAEHRPRVRDYLRSRPETSDGEFTLPMVTCVVRAVRGAR